MYQDKIRELAVSFAEAFINNKIPLSESIALVAKSHSYNPDQIKRLIEATNQLTYLKLQTITDNRTFEFPLADYSDVMSKLLIGTESMSKEASVYSKKTPLEIMNEPLEMDKVASENKDSLGLDERTRHYLISQELLKTAEVVKRLEDESDILLQNMTNAAEDFGKEDSCLEKLAMVSTEKEYRFFSKFIPGLEKSASELDSEIIFKDSDLSVARDLCNMYKSAESMTSLKNDHLGNIEKAAKVLGIMAKGIAKLTGKTTKKVLTSGTGMAGIGGVIDYSTKPGKKDVVKSLQKII